MATKQGWIKRKERYGESGCKHPEERIRKISENTKKALAKPEVKLKIMEDRKRRREEGGYIISSATRKKMSDAMKKRWANGEITDKQKNSLVICRENSYRTQFKKGHHVPESWREAVRKNRATQKFPLIDSSIEVKIQNFLKELGIEFFTHQYMKIDHGYQCDILIPSMNMVIECDGNYWHKYPAGLDKDHIRTRELIEKGFKVLRLWESEIKQMSLNDFKIKIEQQNGV